MASGPCPQCRVPTAQALGKTYCPHCGWNREAAEKRTRLLLRLLPMLVIVFDAPLIVWIFLGHAQMSILATLGALALIPAILVVVAVRGKKTRLAMADAHADTAIASAGGAASSSQEPHESPDDQYAALAELQRPRTVQMNAQGKMNVAIISIALLVLAGLLTALAVVRPKLSNAPSPNRWVYAVPFALVILVALVMRRALARQRQLLTFGETAQARITKHWDARNGRGIRYEFTPSGGEPITAMSTDYSRTLSEGMLVPVFYDPQKPENQIAACAAFYEVARRKRKSRS